MCKNSRKSHKLQSHLCKTTQNLLIAVAAQKHQEAGFKVDAIDLRVFYKPWKTTFLFISM